MAAGQRKFRVTDIRFTREAGEIRCDVEYSWGIEEADGVVRERRGNSVSFSKAELVALLTAGERTGILTVFGKIQTATKVKAMGLATAVEE